jgi:uracil-DNA glycosylase family 4
LTYDPRSAGCKCDQCPLRGSKVVPPEGSKQAHFAVVGSAPREEDVRIGRPFVGPRGEELERCIRIGGARRADAYYTFVTLCQPPNNDLKRLEEDISRHNKKKENADDQLMSPIDCCAPRLQRELASFSRIITLGKEATTAVTGNNASIMAIRGGLQERNATDTAPARQILPTISPSYAIKNPRWLHVLRSDIAKAIRWFYGRAGWVEPEITINPTPRQLASFLAKHKSLAFDLETDGIESLEAKIRCVGIGTADEVMVVGFLSKDGYSKFYTEEAEAECRRLLSDYFTDTNKKKIGHNAGYYDYIVLEKQWGIVTEPIVDTILLHKSVESELPHSLGYVASLMTDAPSWKTDREGNKLSSHAETDHELHVYCGLDVAITARVCKELLEAVRLRDQVKIYKVDRELQKACVDMHWIGMYVDQELRAKKEKELLRRRFDLLHEIRDRTGIEYFNPASTLQMRDLLFEKWRLDPPIEDKFKYTDSGDMSTGDAILRSLLTDAKTPADQREIIKKMRYYRKVLKLLGTYVAKLRYSNIEVEDDLDWDEEEEWNDKETRKKYGIKKRGIVDPYTGRMHPGYNAHVALTGRLSSSKPLNAQNFPKKLRSLVIPAPGHVLVGADMDQVELRIAAALWDVELYLQAFRDNKDPHSMTAFAVFGEAFCKAAGVDPSYFRKPGKLVGTSYDETGKFIGGGEAKKYRDLSKAVQYASVAKGTKVAVLDERREVEIQDLKPGDWVWSWSKKRQRMEPSRVKNVWNHGTKPCYRINFRSLTRSNLTYSEIATGDHPFVLRDGRLRHAHSLGPGDRLLPCRRLTRLLSGSIRDYVCPFATSEFYMEARVVAGIYDKEQQQDHIHHINENTRDNRPSNLLKLASDEHYWHHKEQLDAARVKSAVWRAAVSDPATRSAASLKAWERRRENKDNDRTFGPRESKLDDYTHLIGIKTDQEVAALAGCTPELVGMWRKKNDIPPSVRQQGGMRDVFRRDELWQRLLHDHSDSFIADLFNEEFGTDYTPHSVRQTRRALGIPAPTGKPRKKRKSPVDAVKERVGHESDKTLARELGVEPHVLAYYRKKHGIPAYWKDGTQGDNHMVTSVEPLEGEYEVWDIEVEHEDHLFALASGVFVHNSQYMATPETVHALITKTEKENEDGTTDLPYALLPLKQVRKMRDDWLKGAHQFESGWQREIEEYRRQGYLAEPITGRRRDFLDGENPNEIVNFKVQSSAAAMMNEAMIQLREAIPRNKWGPGTGIINQCHDAIAVECPADQAEWVAGLIEECMNQRHSSLPGVLFSASADIGMSWDKV